MRDKLGICQWFHYQDYDAVERAVDLLGELGVRHVRTGISWADYFRPDGSAWYAFQMEALADFEVLLSVWHTPPSIALGDTPASPPARLQDYADFIDRVIQEHGDRFADLELWNEPNNRLKWDFERFDPEWRMFAEMIGMAAHWARQCGRRTVLGGMIPVDPHWLRLVAGHGALESIDVVAIHGFPGMWWPDAPNWDWYGHWHGWADKIETIAREAGDRPVWVTETGLATCDVHTGRPERFDLQEERLEAAAAAPTERVYWYCLEDLDPERSAIEGFHVDENEYHLGLVDWQGRKKPAWFAMVDLLSRKAPERIALAAGSNPLDSTV